jgi:putative hemolysin
VNAQDPIHTSPDYEAKKIKAILATRIMVVIVVSLAIVIVAVQLFTTLQIRSTQKVSSSNTKVIKALAEQIKSCTTPGGECSKRGAKQTGQAVTRIGTQNLAIVVCADQPGQQTERQIRRCAADIIRRVERRG